MLLVSNLFSSAAGIISNNYFAGPGNPAININHRHYEYTECCILSPDIHISVMGKEEENTKHNINLFHDQRVLHMICRYPSVTKTGGKVGVMKLSTGVGATLGLL